MCTDFDFDDFREDDRLILETCKRDGTEPVTFQSIAEILGKTSEQVSKTKNINNGISNVICCKI